MSKGKLKFLLKNSKNIMIQPSRSNVLDDQSVFSTCIISNLQPEQIISSFSVYPSLRTTDTLLKIENNEILEETRYCNHLSKRLLAQDIRGNKRKIIICNPPKTADFSLNFTFNKLNGRKYNSILDIVNKGKILFYIRSNSKILYKIMGFVIKPFNRNYYSIDYENIFHRPSVFGKQYNNESPIKIITAVREPISQNLSMLYEDIATSTCEHKQWLYRKVYGTNNVDIDEVFRDSSNLFIENGNNIQMLFDDFINEFYLCNKDLNLPLEFCIQKFFLTFNQNIINLHRHPFDKQAGYSIIREGNIEVFVYQLEKLNSIVPQLSEWIGVPFDKLENGNVGSDKWIGESYKQAQKEIEISQEYFDRCFNEEYVRHFYSEEDIEKFKARWRPHIKK